VSKEIRREQEKLEENNVENLRKNEHLRFIGCRLVTKHQTRTPRSFSAFLKMVDDRLSALLKEFKERMTAVKAS